MNRIIKTAGASMLALVAQSALAQFTITGGVDYSEGKYGAPEDTTQWVYSLVGKYESGPFTLRVNVPYIDVEGAANRDVGGAVGLRDSQSGLGDITVFGAYNVLPVGAGVGVDLGAKVKFVTADKDKYLLTTGNEDYSLQLDLYKGFGALTAFGTLGWTYKGDIRVPNFAGNVVTGFDELNPRNPWYGSVGASYKLTDATSFGLAYDYREKLFDNSNEISEATLFVTHKFTKSWKGQVYGVGGFSDGSPDWGLGATMGYSF
jgi:hypothetical protein